jgi:hypothetical protein
MFLNASSINTTYSPPTLFVKLATDLRRRSSSSKTEARRVLSFFSDTLQAFSKEIVRIPSSPTQVDYRCLLSGLPSSCEVDCCVHNVCCTKDEITPAAENGTPHRANGLYGLEGISRREAREGEAFNLSTRNRGAAAVRGFTLFLLSN